MSETTKTPIEAEAAGDETLTVTWDYPERIKPKGKKSLKFTIPASRADWPFEADLALREDDSLGLVVALLPDDKLTELRALKPTSGEVASISLAVAAALGFADAGESPASSD